MIIGVCSDKGAPGVTTLATALALAWEGTAILLEADPSGADLVFRLHRPEEEFLASEPSVRSLALAARSGDVGGDLARFTQSTSLGVSVIAGQAQAEDWAPVRGLWPQVAGEVAAWPGPVIADLGRLQPGHPGVALAQAVEVMLLMSDPTVEGLFHVRARTEELARLLGGRPRNPVGVVVRAGQKKHKRVVDDVTQLLQTVGSPVPVAGWVADDPGGVAALLAGADTAHLRRSALMRSVVDLIARIHRTWPDTAVAAGTVDPAHWGATFTHPEGAS